MFEEWLIDHETASNSGNWQWLACTAFFLQFYRCYSPIAFPQKWDKEGVFVEKYVPELKGLDKKWIYEPWKAALADQKKARVKIQGDGKDAAEGVYPIPMFDFGERRTICLDGMKKAYQAGLYGDHPKVIDGTWRELFEDDGERPTEGKSFENAMGNGAGSEDKIQEGPEDGDSGEGAVAEDESGAKDTGRETKGGDERGLKRKKAQKTIDMHLKKLRSGK